LGLGLEFVTRCVASATHDHGFESPDFIRKTPTPNPGLTWILSGIRNPILHDVLIALKRVKVERHIDVNRDVGSAFEVAKKWWAEKKSHEPPSLPFFCPLFFCPSISNLKLRFL
jgi:hypothetical protein